MRPLRSITRRRFIAGNCQIKELSPSMGLLMVPHLLQFSPPEQLRISFLVLRKFPRDRENPSPDIRSLFLCATTAGKSGLPSRCSCPFISPGASGLSSE